MIKRLPSFIQPIIFRSCRGYHLLSMLESKYQTEQIKLNPMLFPLYLDRLRVGPFSERFLIVLAVDCYRTSQPPQRLQQIVEYAVNNLHLFQNRITLVVLLNQIYFFKYSNKTVIDQLIRKAFEIEEKEDSGYSFYNLKLLILINELIGIDKYPEEMYRRINFKKFKPLSIAMSLQIFCDKKLKQQYKLTEELVDMFVACQSFVPFADVHHLSYAIRRVDNARFRECFYRIRARIQATLKKGKEEKEEVDEGNKWTTDEELILEFRRNIENKYRLAQ